MQSLNFLNKSDLARIKHVIFDVDGVIISGCPRASQAAAEKFGLNRDKIDEFFKTKWTDCVEGRKCVKELLASEISAWGFNGSVSDYLEFWFTTESKVDNEVLELAAKFKDVGKTCHIGSNQEFQRANYLWNQCGLKNHFSSSFYSSSIGFSKPNFDFYIKIQESLKAHPNEFLLIDDANENVMSARDCGWSGLLWPNHKHLILNILDQI